MNENLRVVVNKCSKHEAKRPEQHRDTLSTHELQTFWHLQTSLENVIKWGRYAQDLLAKRPELVGGPEEAVKLQSQLSALLDAGDLSKLLAISSHMSKLSDAWGRSPAGDMP